MDPVVPESGDDVLEILVGGGPDERLVLADVCVMETYETGNAREVDTIVAAPEDVELVRF